MNGMLYVYKSMQGKLKNEWRSHIIFILMILMMVALFFSRVALSAGIIAFTAVSIIHPDYKKQFRYFFASPLLWGMSLLFFLPLISGLWSSDKQEWWLMMQIKLPLFLLPLAFAGKLNLTKKQWEWLSYIFIGLVTAASIWSMAHYINNMEETHQGYLRSKTIVTPLENDHVRFSWLISVAALLSGWLVIAKRKEQQLTTWILGITVAWLIIFLHILAARTGLICFYIMLAGVGFWFVAKKSKWQYGLLLLLIIMSLPFVAYQTLPTFQNRVKYFLYEFDYFKKTNYLPGANDAVRVISIKAGWNVMKQQPVTGVGFGDVISETKKWYGINYPGMTEADKIYPSSEWMLYGAGAGWPGLIVFLFVMCIPFFTKTHDSLLWILLNSTAAFSLLFDIGLEVQFGVFIYSFLILWWWQWLKAEKM